MNLKITVMQFNNNNKCQLGCFTNFNNKLFVLIKLKHPLMIKAVQAI